MISTTYLIEATEDGYRMAATSTPIPKLLEPGDVTLTETGGHGVIEAAYGQAERHFHDALSVARSTGNPTAERAR